MTKQSQIRRFLFWSIVLLTVAISIGPFAWQIITSVTPARELTSLPPILPNKTTGIHYSNVFSGRPFHRYIINSGIVASATTVLSLFVGSFASYSLARLPIKGRYAILGVVLAVSMFPQIAIVSALYLIFRSLGLLNTHFGLVIAYSTFSLPLTIWILTSFFREIPMEMEEAAKVDGCTPVQTFVRVILPLAAPGFFTTAILVFIYAWNEFLFALTFTNNIKTQTIPVGIAMLPTMYHVPFGDIAAASVVVTIPLVFLVFIFQRRIIQGLTAGAVKG